MRIYPLYLILAVLVAAAPAPAANIVVIPPNVTYLNGYEPPRHTVDCSGNTAPNKACAKIRKWKSRSASEYHRIFSDLGQEVFLNMGNGIKLFNAMDRSMENRLSHTAVSAVFTSWPYNDPITRFHEGKKRGPAFLDKVLAKFNSRFLVWATFDRQSKRAFRQFVASGSPEKSFMITLNLHMYDGSQIETRQVPMKYLSKFSFFRDTSLESVSESIRSYLAEKSLPAERPAEESSEI